MFLFGFIQDSDRDETWAQVLVGILTVTSEDVSDSPNHLHFDPLSTAIIVEGGIAMDNLQNLPQAPWILFGLSYIVVKGRRGSSNLQQHPAQSPKCFTECHQPCDS